MRMSHVHDRRNQNNGPFSFFFGRPLQLKLKWEACLWKTPRLHRYTTQCCTCQKHRQPWPPAISRSWCTWSGASRSTQTGEGPVERKCFLEKLYGGTWLTIMPNIVWTYWGMYAAAAGSSYFDSSSLTNCLSFPVLEINASITFFKASLDCQVELK